MLKHWILIRGIQIVVDFILIYAAFLGAYFWRVGFVFSSDFPFSLFAILGFVSALIWVGVLIMAKYYRVPPRSGKREIFDFLLIFFAGAVSLGFLIVSYFFPREILFSRLIAVYIFLLGSGALMVSNFAFRSLLAGVKNSDKNCYKTLIVGANRVAEKIVASIGNDRFAPHKILGVIDPYGMEKTIKGSTILGKLDKMETISEAKEVNCIIQCDAFEHTTNIVSFCEEEDIKYLFAPYLRGVFHENLRLRETASHPYVSFVKRDFTGLKKLKYKWVDRILRQVFDVD